MYLLHSSPLESKIKGVNNVSVWSHRRIGIFLTTWNLASPFYTVIPIDHLNHTLFYAALWAYLPGGNPISPTPLVFDITIPLFFLPFYATGLVIAWLAWKGAIERDLTRGRYVEIVILLQVIHVLIVWLILPCPISSSPHLCLAIPTTGLVALLFRSKVVEEITTPWIEQDTSTVQD